MRAYAIICGGAAPEAEQPSAEQLGALHAIVLPGGALFADFAVFGPHDVRVAKWRRFEGKILVDHMLVTQKMAGPSGFPAWRRCWRVFRACAIALHIANPSELDAYEEGLRALTELYPAHWGLIARADETLRSEQWERAQVDAVANGLSPWLWGALISRSAYTSSAGSWTGFWFNHVAAPALASGRPQQAQDAVDRLEGWNTPAADAPSGFDSPTWRASGQGAADQEGQGSAGPGAAGAGGVLHAPRWGGLLPMEQLPYGVRRSVPRRTAARVPELRRPSSRQCLPGVCVVGSRAEEAQGEEGARQGADGWGVIAGRRRVLGRRRGPSRL